VDVSEIVLLNKGRNMNDLEVLKKAQYYIETLTNGVNPIDGVIINDDSALNNARIIRCLFYVNDILKKLIENDGKIVNIKSNKKLFEFDEQLMKKVEIQTYSISLSQIIRNISNVFVDCQKLKYSWIANMLKDKGILIENTNGYPKQIASPSAKEYGITTELIHGNRGDYYRTVYNAKGQKFVIENLLDINKYIN